MIYSTNLRGERDKAITTHNNEEPHTVFRKSYITVEKITEKI